MEYKEFDDKFLFASDPDQQKEEMAFLNKRAKNQDGIYRPTLEEAADVKVGYKSKIRFLKNLTRGGKLSAAAVEKHIHYVAKGPFESYPELTGYYDCERNHKEKCELCGMYWKLKKSKNQADVENADLLSRSTKYYSYVMILEDVQHPELVGKIMVFSYGYKIKEKINIENTGEVTGVPCNVFDFGKGKDFMLLIKENKTPLGVFPSYDNSQFLETSPMKIFNEKTGKFVTVPVVDGEIVDPKWQMKIKETLLSRDEKVNLEDHMPKVEWTDEERIKVGKIISVLNGNDVNFAENATRDIRHTAPTTKPQSSSNEIEDMDAFFNTLDDEN
jgi:hypothetical protein